MNISICEDEPDGGLVITIENLPKGWSLEAVKDLADKVNDFLKSLKK